MVKIYWSSSEQKREDLKPEDRRKAREGEHVANLLYGYVIRDRDTYEGSYAQIYCMCLGVVSRF